MRDSAPISRFQSTSREMQATSPSRSRQSRNSRRSAKQAGTGQPYSACLDAPPPNVGRTSARSRIMGHEFTRERNGAMIDTAQQNQTDELPEFKRRDAYADWQQAEGVPVIKDYVFDDLMAIEVGPWPRKGGKGAVINIPNPNLPNDAHLVEIPPGGQSEPESHLYEEMVFIVSGRGSTSVWFDESAKQTFEWGPGSLFAIPLNTTYQIYNGSGLEPIRYLSVT